MHLLKLSGDVAASLELPGTTRLAELQPLAEAALGKMNCKLKLVIDGRLLRDLPADLSLESLL